MQGGSLPFIWSPNIATKESTSGGTINSNLFAITMARMGSNAMIVTCLRTKIIGSCNRDSSNHLKSRTRSSIAPEQLFRFNYY